MKFGYELKLAFELRVNSITQVASERTVTAAPFGAAKTAGRASTFAAISTINTRTMSIPVPHPRRRLATALAAAAASVAAAAAIAQDPKPAAPTPPPATAPVVPAAPLAGPKAVAIAFAVALDKGDAATAKALIPADDARGRWVDAAIALSAALKKLDAAAVAKFGEAGKVVSQNQLHLADSLKSLEQAQEKIEGDAATLTVPGQAKPLNLKKVEGRWQLQVGPSKDEVDRQLSLHRRLARAAEQTAAEIGDGSLTSAERASRVFTERALNARLGL